MGQLRVGRQRLIMSMHGTVESPFVGDCSRAIWARKRPFTADLCVATCSSVRPKQTMYLVASANLLSLTVPALKAVCLE